MDNQSQAALRRAIGMLESILLRQTELHREMVALADGKQESIIKGDLERLELIVAEEKRLVGKIEEEEKRRLAVMPLVRSGVGAGEEMEKLPEVIALMPEPEKTRMSAVRNELRAVLEECQRRTRHNAELLRTSLEHVEAFLRTVTEANAKDNLYGKDGRRTNGGPSIIDRNA